MPQVVQCCPRAEVRVRNRGLKSGIELGLGFNSAALHLSLPDSYPTSNCNTTNVMEYYASSIYEDDISSIGFRPLPYRPIQTRNSHTFKLTRDICFIFASDCIILFAF